ncbi:TniQ protein [Bradyrhizobium sp. NFR13]|nr:TniQ protein [Bradyrhizobium sp. NFR13]
MLAKYTDLHGRGEPPLPSWDDPRHDEPAHGYFVRLAGLNDQLSASVVASSFGLNGRGLQPSECLDFAMSFPVENKERLLSATPTVNTTTVTMFGETFRRRDWSIDRRYFCPGCLAEDAYHRSFWDLAIFRHCPFHDKPLRCVDASGHEVPWWSPSFEFSPFGNAIAEHRNRASSVGLSIEAYTLGRLGLIDKLPVPVLDNLATFVQVFSAIEFAGKLVLRGRRERRPSTSAFGKNAVFRAGFDMLSKGDDAINHVLKTVAADKNGRAPNKERGLSHLFGWAYPAAKYSQDFGALFTARMIEVAAAQDGLARSVRNLNEVKQRAQLIDAADLSRELGIAKQRVREIAVALGIRQSCSRSYVAFSKEEACLLRRTVVELIDRDEAARFLDVARPFFDSLVHLGLVPVFTRMRGPGMDRFRPQDIHSFATSLIERADRLETDHLTGRMLKEVRRSSRTNPARLVQQIIDGVIPILGRRGESFGSITINSQSKPSTLRYPRRRVQDDANGVGMLDAAAALGVQHSAIVELRKLEFLKHSKSSPKLLDRYGFDIFCKTYCASRHYAPILKCRPQELPRRLRDLGIRVLRLEHSRGGINLVDRADARRVLGLLSDPDAAPIGSQRAFIAELAEHVRKTTTFRLLSQIDGLAFRTGRGTFRLFMTIDWERGTLRVGPKCNSRKSPRAQSDLLQRKSQIETVFGPKLTWIRDNDWLRVYTSVENLSFDKPARWAGICAQVVEIFAEFKKHFEPPQQRY